MARVNLFAAAVLNSKKYDTVRVEFANGQIVNMAFSADTLWLLQNDPDVVEVMDNQTGELYKRPQAVAVEA